MRKNFKKYYLYCQISPFRTFHIEKRNLLADNPNFKRIHQIDTGCIILPHRIPRIPGHSAPYRARRRSKNMEFPVIMKISRIIYVTAHKLRSILHNNVLWTIPFKQTLTKLKGNW